MAAGASPGSRGLVAVTESDVEDAVRAWLAGLGNAVRRGPDIGLDGLVPERGSHGEVPSAGRLRARLARLNPPLPGEVTEEGLRKLRQSVTPAQIEENRRLHRRLVESVPVEPRPSSCIVAARPERRSERDPTVSLSRERWPRSGEIP